MWFFVFFLALVIYLATGSLLLSSLVPYLAAAQPAIDSAFWLRSEDPVCWRGRVCFWFYLATAGWRAATAALITVGTFMAAVATTGKQPDMDAFARTMIVLMGGLLIATFLGWLGVARAWSHRLPVYVLPNLHRLCNGSFANIPAVIGDRPRWNHAVFVLASSLFVPIVGIGGAMAMLGANDRNPNASNTFLESLGLGVVLTGPLLALPVYAFLSRRVLAPNAWDCWYELWLSKDLSEAP